MTQEKVDSPLPSMVNYPEPDNLDGISEIGFDQTGARYKVNASSGEKLEYALGWRTGERSAEFAVNNPAYWNAFESNNSKIEKITGSSEFYRIQLAAGAVYKLVGSVSVLESPPSRIYRGFRWYNTTAGVSFGSQGGFVNGTDGSYAGGGSGAAIAYIKPTATTIVELRCSYASTDSDYQEYGTSFNIEVLNATSL
jgi:hypothetical protein